MIIVQHTCGAPHLRRTKVSVKERMAEDVAAWMEQTCIPALMADHSARSPECRTDKFAEVMIPLTGTSKIGGPVEN